MNYFGMFSRLGISSHSENRFYLRFIQLSEARDDGNSYTGIESNFKERPNDVCSERSILFIAALKQRDSEQYRVTAYKITDHERAGASELRLTGKKMLEQTFLFTKTC